ncbi:MAG TPA: hypothetical protein VJZ27_02240, partial [Aggregatilineales bacterium]|nr:hypothetical protein [Aggregatilineales bacterium]
CHSKSEFFRMNFESRELEQITHFDSDVFSAHWSPEGDWWYINLLESDQWDLFRMRPDVSQLQRLTHDALSESVIGWTPDHEWLLYTGSENGMRDFYRVRFDGSIQQRLTDMPADVFWTGMSPDREWLIFTSAHDGDVYQVRMDGSQLKPLVIADGRNYFAGWLPPVDMSFAGKWLLLLSLFGSVFFRQKRPFQLHF